MDRQQQTGKNLSLAYATVSIRPLTMVGDLVPVFIGSTLFISPNASVYMANYANWPCLLGLWQCFMCHWVFFNLVNTDY